MSVISFIHPCQPLVQGFYFILFLGLKSCDILNFDNFLKGNFSCICIRKIKISKRNYLYIYFFFSFSFFLFTLNEVQVQCVITI